MHIKISQHKVIENLPLLFLMLSSCEFLYARTTGEKTSIILGSFSAIGCIYIFLSHSILTKNDGVKILFCIWVLVWTNNSQSIRYFLTLFAVMCWCKIPIKKLDYYVRSMVFLGFILSVLQFIRGNVRIYGFYANSPTQFACNLYLFEAYLLIRMANEGFDKLNITSAAICIVLIFMTETRSVLYAASIVFFVYFIMICINGSRIKSRKQLFVLSLLVFFIILFLNSDMLMQRIQSRFQRTNTDASNYTRMYMYNKVLGILRENLRIVFFGGRGGYAHELFGIAGTYLPIHQDFLLILIEYGIVGFTLLLIVFLSRHKNSLFYLIVFSACSFHNVILNPVIMITAAVMMVNLENKGYSVLPLKSCKFRVNKQTVME